MNSSINRILIKTDNNRAGRKDMNCYSFLIEHMGQRFVVSDIYHDTEEQAFNALLGTISGATLIEVYHS